MTTDEVKLLRTWSSPFALRVVWALKLKGIEYDTVYEDLANKSTLLLQLNPIHKKVPVLVHNGKSLSESLVIIEYIDDSWKQNPLLPQDPYQRAVDRFWAKFNDENVLPSVWNVFVNEGKMQEEAVEVAQENLKHLEEHLSLKGKKFFAGDEIGFLDLALGWIVNLMSVIEEVAGLTIADGDKFPSLFSWRNEFANAPIIKENWPSRDQLVAKYKVMHEHFLVKA